MGHRLSRIVTRTGDGGDTGLTGGARVPKTHARVHAMGDVDELNSQVGVLLTQRLPKTLAATLTRVQHELFNLGGELSMPGTALVKESDLLALEREVEALNRGLPPLKDFVLPGGTPAAAAAHLARAICRRAERAVWAVNALEPLNAATPRYLNRLSDFLFVAARVLARARGRKETQWRGTSRGRR
ncbi:MAG: cob(I)yrinic acid a,c-diamide adenosyltransferase [Nevskiaceae bacterium]